MSTSIRICSYLLLPLIYLLVNVKIAQLGESFPITIVTFLPVLLLLFLERISVKKLMIALGIGAGLTAFNYLFGQSLDASKYVTSTMLFVYIVIIIGMVWSIRFKTISPHNHRKILRFFYLVGGLVVPGLAVRLRNSFPLAFACALAQLAGMAGMWLAPMAAPWLWAILVGIGGCTFPLGLTLINLRTRTPAGSAALSGFTQGVGYTLACLGPLLFGLLHDVSGGLAWPFALLAASVLVMLAGAWQACRPRYLEDMRARS